MLLSYVRRILTILTKLVESLILIADMESEAIAPQNTRTVQPLRAYFRELAQVGLAEANKPAADDPNKTHIEVLIERIMDAAIGADGKKPDLKAADLFFKYVFGVPQVRSRRDLLLILAQQSKEKGISVYDDPALAAIIRAIASGDDSGGTSDRRADDDGTRSHSRVIEAEDREVDA